MLRSLQMACGERGVSYFDRNIDEIRQALLLAEMQVRNRPFLPYRCNAIIVLPTFSHPFIFVRYFTAQSPLAWRILRSLLQSLSQRSRA